MAHSHKRDTNARRTPRAAVIAGPLAALATASAVGIGVLSSTPVASSLLADDAAGSSAVAADLGQLGSVADRGENVSRSAIRSAVSRPPKAVSSATISRLSKAELMLAPAATKQALAAADKTLFTTDLLNLWSGPGKGAQKLGEIKSGKKVTVTGRSLYGRDEIAFNGKSRWVTSGFLAAEKPEPEPEEIGLGGQCTNGSSTSGGANVQAVHEAVCAAFPEISVYGGTRGGGGDHGTGHAVDIMISGSRGQQVADFVRANASALGVSYVIYSQRIWSVERGGEGWRGMSDRGSTTANHYDHVHVSTF